jgi:hypothetical protein
MTSKSTDFWAPKLTGMGAGHEFEGVYDKGILAIHALRRRIGDARSIACCRLAGPVQGGNAPLAEFELFVTNLSGQNLSVFFDDWFRNTDPGRRRPLPRTRARLTGASGT